MNKYRPHIYIIPEDDRDRQIAIGFLNHGQVKDTAIKVMPEAGGWNAVMKIFEDEYIRVLRGSAHAHVVMLIDFDGDFNSRRLAFENSIPVDVRDRVFVIGPLHTPESLRQVLGKSYEEIGTALADDCATNKTEVWAHDQVIHNDSDRQKMVLTVKPFVF